MERVVPAARPQDASGWPGWVRVWLLAARPRTLTAAVIPVLVGTAAAAAQGAMRPVPALGALLAALCIQIGTNFANDYHDFQRGADTHERLGPRRVTQDEIRASFGEGWHVDSIEASKIEINTDPNGALAWRSAITRT